jgi:hypothetical protein
MDATVSSMLKLKCIDVQVDLPQKAHPELGCGKVIFSCDSSRVRKTVRGNSISGAVAPRGVL